MAALQLAELTTTSVDGGGAIDVLLRTVKAHLDVQFKEGRLKGPEYATVYLGSMELAIQSGLTFLLNQRKNDLEAQLLQKQIDLATKQIEKTEAEILTVAAQTALISQQRTNLLAEALNIPLQGTVLVATECKLRAEFDLITQQTTKTSGEISLLAQKTATERAQTQTVGVDADSVVGKQKALYQAQTSGFQRDAEQKAAKVLVDTWSVRRTTDEATAANATNKLDDATVGRVINSLLTGVGA